MRRTGETACDSHLLGVSSEVGAEPAEKMKGKVERRQIEY